MPENLSNMIAAGEVVERPASVVKELIENAVDAGADRIEVICQGSGKRYIRVLDNGHGMTYDDALLCLERHATSKIEHEKDLESIFTLGFRGEALPSIAAVSEMTLTTRPASSPSATRIVIKSGVIREVTTTGAPIGTMVEVKGLFSQVPARAKFLRSPQTELSHIIQTVIRQSIPRPEVSFILSHEGHTMLHMVKAPDLQQRLVQIMGTEVTDEMHEVKRATDGVDIKGLISRAEFHRSNLLGQYLYVNGRFIKSPVIQKTIHGIYRHHLPRQRYPFFCILIDIDPKRVDVNVHPTKLEVRFDNPSKIVDIITTTIREAIDSPRRWAPSSSPLHERGEQSSEPIKGDGPAVRPPRPAPPFSASTPRTQAPLLKEQNKREYLPAHTTQPDSSSPPFEAADQGPMEGLLPLGPFIQIDDSYILYETSDGILVIDQHAAHERINYERIKSSLLAKKTPRQNLLNHPLITVSPEEDALMARIIPVLHDLGFTLEPFGTRTYILRSVPVYLDTDPTQVLQAITQKLLEYRPAQGKEDLIDPLSATLACHLSVRAHQPLKPQEIQQLIQDLLATEHPFSCPHGRPTLFRISKREIEKNFGR
ncbi:MAG: DNA mismatch repair endonuclease MutL [bacterium]